MINVETVKTDSDVQAYKVEACRNCVYSVRSSSCLRVKLVSCVCRFRAKFL